MFWISLTNLPNFFQKPKSFFEDEIDRLSSWIGVSFMLTCCAIATSGLVVGNHFECIIPAHYISKFPYILFSIKFIFILF